MTDATPYTDAEMQTAIGILRSGIEPSYQGCLRLAATLAEIPALRKDKERLDWIESEVLRDFHDQETGEHHLRLAHDFGWVVGGMRTAIDAARSAGEG